MKNKSAQQLGKRGGKARAKALTPERRKAIARAAAQARWARQGYQEAMREYRKFEREIRERKDSK